MIYSTNRLVAIEAVSLNVDMCVGLADVCTGEKIVSEISNISAVASIVFLAEVKNSWLESFDKRTDPSWIGTAKFVDALLGIRECYQAALLTERSDNPPLI